VDRCGAESLLGDRALPNIVDSDNPLLRVFFGSDGYQMVRQVYASRVKTCADWQDLSAEAHGMLDQLAV
jgi:hypothetical protein